MSAQTSDPQVTDSTRLLARHDELWGNYQATGRAEDYQAWEAWIASLSPKALNSLALELGRRGLDKLGCAEVAL